MLVFVSFVFLALVIRLPFLIMSKAGSTNDRMGVYSKLLFLSKSSFNSYKIGDAINHEGFFPRPNLLHYIVSRLPRKLWRIALVLGNVLPDIIVGLLLVVYLDYCSLVALFSLESSLVFLAFTSGPILFPQTARLKATNGRTLGFMLSAIYFVALFELSLRSDDVSLVWIVGTAIICLFLVFWTSTFASQAVLFLSVAFALVSLDLRLLIPLAIFLPLAWFVKPLGVKSLIQFKLAHTKFYARVLMSSFSTRKRGLLNFVKLLDPSLKRAERIDLILKHSPIIIATYSIPAVFLLFFLWNQDALSLSSSFAKTQIEFAFAIFLVFIITSISWGKLFGESERYLEYAQFSLLALLATSFSNSDVSFILSLISLQFCIIGIVSLLTIPGTIEKFTTFQGTYPQEVKEIVEYLHQIDGQKNVLCVPLRFSRALSSYSMSSGYSDIKYYYRLVVSGENTATYLDQSMEEMYDQNIPALSPKEFNARYEVNYFVLSEGFEAESKFYDELESQTNVILKTDSISLRSLKEAS